MEFSRLKTGRLEVSLFLCLLASSCNPDDYFKTLETVEGRDAFCAQAKDLNSCLMVSDLCQPAYVDSENDFEEPIFSVCIANPIIDPPATDGGTGTTPTDPVADDGTGTTPTDPVADDGTEATLTEPPTIAETIAANCKNLDEKYLWIKNVTETTKKNGSKKSSTSKVIKVKVCHQTGNLSKHSIVIACPALKAHKHHDDSIGACEH